MKKFLVILAAIISTSALADYRLIIPQEPGNGTDIWARVVAREWEKKLGEHMVIENIPGANDIPGFNKFHNSLRKDPKVIMVAHGGNGESFLYQNVDYDYKYYDPIGLQNLTIMVGKSKAMDPWKDTIKFSNASGSNPDMIAMVMLVCGPGKTLQEYKDCYKAHFKYVTGMTGNERKLAYMRSETNAVRETPVAYFKNIRPIESNVDWFNPGVLDLKTGKVGVDANFPNVTFTDVYKAKWGVVPSGDLYQAWLLDKNYRDVLQKALFIDKGNPNRDKLRASLKAMLEDPVSLAVIEKETGKYQWILGDDVTKAQASLEALLTKKALKDLVWFISQAFGQEAIYKDNIAAKAK
jgi:hypothetical protein